jgi:hypothetical protein
MNRKNCPKVLKIAAKTIETSGNNLFAAEQYTKMMKVAATAATHRQSQSSIKYRLPHFLFIFF